MEMPNRLLNFLIEKLGVHTDGQLCDKLGIFRGCISEIRTGKRKAGAIFWLAAHEATGIPSLELKKIGGYHEKNTG